MGDAVSGAPFHRWLVILLVVAVAGVTAAALATTEPARRPKMPGAPAIVWGTRVGHADRGMCTDCHRVVSRDGERMPTIHPSSFLPHEFRGVCNNCHVVEASRLLAFAPAAAIPNPAGPNSGLAALVARALGGDGE